jgi:FKBP-type peptidyl-prolyl cis-trans isomerase
MKFLVLATSLLLSIQTFAQRPQVKAGIVSPIRIVTSSDSLQYTLGAYLGQYILTNGFTITNPELFKKGMDDVLLKKPLLVNAATIPQKIDAYQKRLIAELSSRQEKLLFENIKGKPGFGNLPSGVSYAIIKNGNGARPRATDSVLVHVKGYLPDGKLFEDTYAKKAPLRTTPLGLIPGMNEALQIMPSGSAWRLYIPSSLGYGDKGYPGVIPAYSALVFDVELVSIIETAK